GCRAFIAFSGGLAIEPSMGSRSTYLKAKIGGLAGRKLDKEDEIAFRAPKTTLPNLAKRHLEPEDFSGTEHTLRVVLGPQDTMFTEKGVATFLSETYSVTNQFDRMGCRLDGEVIQHIKEGNIISDGISFGAVQVPSEGKPIIMLADRQTVGGYTKIATVISADFSVIAQAKAGDKIHFSKVSVTAAQDLYLAERRYLRALKSTFEAMPTPPRVGDFLR
ncbi:MAG: biotin-dependent carboxyltransferase family protein, partial [Pygmaiobacter sp.]